MNKIYKISAMLFVLFVFVWVSGCSDPITSNGTAVEMTVTKIEESPFNGWFAAELQSYQPDTNIVNQIKAVFKPDSIKLIFYGNFNCGCPGKGVRIADCIKIMNDCGIADSCYKIYSMQATSDSHPYNKYITVNVFPSAFVMKDTVVVSSVLDTLSDNPNSSIEAIFLNALMK